MEIGGGSPRQSRTESKSFFKNARAHCYVYNNTLNNNKEQKKIYIFILKKKSRSATFAMRKEGGGWVGVRTR